MGKSIELTNPADYMKLSGPKLAERYHNLCSIISGLVDAEGWSRHSGQLSRERNMIDAIGHYRFDDWFLIKKKQATRHA